MGIRMDCFFAGSAFFKSNRFVIRKPLVYDSLYHSSYKSFAKISTTLPHFVLNVWFIMYYGVVDIALYLPQSTTSTTLSTTL